MDRQLIEIIVIDELVNNFLKEQQFVLTESQQRLIEESVIALLEAVFNPEEREAAIKRHMETHGVSREEAEKDIGSAEKETERDLPDNQPKDETPGELDPEEKKEAGGAKNDLMQTLKQKGIVGAAAAGVGKVANKVFTALFGQGYLQRREDAEQMINQINTTGKTPAAAAQELYQSLYRFKQAGPLVGGSGGAPPTGAPTEDPGEDAGSGGSEFAVPVFKKFSGADQEKGAHPRSLSSQLMKLFPDVPKSAITQILKGVAAQLRTSNVPIQENKNIIAKVLIENLNVLAEASREERIAARRRKSHGKKGKTIAGDPVIPKILKKQLKDIRKKLGIAFDTTSLLNKIRSILKDSLAPSDEAPLRVQGGPAELEEAAETPYVIRLSDLHKAIMNAEMTDGGKIDPDDAQKIAEELSTWLEGYAGANITVDHGQEDTEEEPEEEQEAPDSDLFNKFKETLKRLDLHTSEGREAAKQTEAAYLGAYKFYKAMKLAFDAIKTNRLDVRTVRIEKLLTPLNEKQGENEQAAGKDLRTWLGNMINIFDEVGLNDRERGMKASKSARGAEDPKEKGYSPADVKSADGVVNTRQSVGPQLKAAGIDLKSPEGQALQKKMLKVIRRFLNKNMQRMGKQDIKIISEKLIKELRNRGII